MNCKRLYKVLVWNLISSLPARELTLETRNGNLTFNTRDYVLGKHLYVDRNYEFDAIQRVLSIISEIGLPLNRRSSIFIDVGANIGTITVALMRSGLFSRGLAFEPDPYNFSLLQKNVQQNRFQKAVQCFNFALSSETRIQNLELASDNFGDHRIRTDDSRGYFAEERRKTVSVPVKPLDLVLDSAQRRDISLIWLDIQGHEGHFFKGAEKVIMEARPAVLMEFWPYAIRRSGLSREDYCELLSRLFADYIHLTRNKRGPVESTDSFERWFDYYSNPKEMGVFLLF